MFMDQNMGELLFVPVYREFFVVLRGATLKCAFDHVVLAGQEACVSREPTELFTCSALVQVADDGQVPGRDLKHESHSCLVYAEYIRFIQSMVNTLVAIRVGCTGVLAPCLAQLASMWPIGVLVRSMAHLELYVERAVDILSARLGPICVKNRERLLRKYSHTRLLDFGDRMHYTDWLGFKLGVEGEYCGFIIDLSVFFMIGIFFCVATGKWFLFSSQVRSMMAPEPGPERISSAAFVGATRVPRVVVHDQSDDPELDECLTGLGPSAGVGECCLLREKTSLLMVSFQPFFLFRLGAEPETESISDDSYCWSVGSPSGSFDGFHSAF